MDVFGGYSRDNANGVQRGLGLQTEEVWRAGATWAWQNLKFMGQYEQIHHAIGSATCTTAAALVANPLAAGSSGQCNSAMNWGGNGNIWHAGGQYKWGNTTLVAQGGMTHAHAGGIIGIVGPQSRELYRGCDSQLEQTYQRLRWLSACIYLQREWRRG